MNKRIALFAGIIALVALAVVLLVTPQHEEMVKNSEHSQDTIAYQFELKTTGTLNSSVIMSALFGSPINAPLQNLKENLSGTLVIQSVDEDDSIRIVHLFKLQGTDPDIANDLSKAALVALTSNGAFRLDEALPYTEPQRDLLLNLLSKLQVVTSKSSSSSWQTQEQDNVGVYEAVYTQKDKLHLERSKTEYLPGQARSKTMFDLPNAQLTVINSIDNIVLHTNLKQVNSVDSSQQLELHQGNDNVLKITQHLNLTTTDSEAVLANKLTVQEVKAQYQQAVQSLAGNKDQTSLQFQTNEEVIGWFAQALENDEDTAIEQLTAWLQDNPAQVAALIEFMNAHLADISDEVDLRLWYAMAQSNTAEAQRAFSAAMTNEGYDLLIRTRAIVYSHDFVNPSKTLTDSLWQVYELKANDVSQDEKELSSMALYALGSLMNADEISAQLQSALSKEMVKQLNSATTDDQASEVLTAMSNSRLPVFIDTFEKYTSSNSARIIASAFDSLANLESSEATDVMVEKLDLLEAGPVREHATKSLISAVPTDKSIQWAGKALLSTKNETEQGHLIQYLGKHVQEYPEAETALRQILKQESLTITQKRLIYRYVSPK